MNFLPRKCYRMAIALRYFLIVLLPIQRLATLPVGPFAHVRDHTTI